MSSWHSYPSIYALGHAALKELFADDVLVEEKIDGSQFSFGRFEGELKARSKGKELIIDAPEKMFAKAVEVIQSLPLRDGWTYRTEYLQKPKHNALAYDRIPSNHLIVFDINTDEETYLPYEEKAQEARRLGLEVVPSVFQGKIEGADSLMALLDCVSILGGQKIEGIVIKNYAKFGPDKKVLMGKFVSEAFKEVHKGEWRAANPTKADIIQSLVMAYRTPARWNKAIQHLREAGTLEGTPRDIGGLIKEVQADIFKECQDEIKEALFSYVFPMIKRSAVAGLPEWYKEQLAKSQFEEVG